MKKIWFFCLLFFVSHNGFSQAYIPMPTDSAVWRYRIYDVDFITQIFDNILFLDGTDTFANGNTYHKLIGRAHAQTVPNGTVPPVVTDTATSPDNPYAGIRESGKQVFLLTLHGEELIYDFNAAVGDSIHAYSGLIKVTAIDSVLLGGVYHKRFLTTDTAYYIIEGVGSSEGLIPDMNDGLGDLQFMCFTSPIFTFSPDTSVSCTYVYPIGYGLSVNTLNAYNKEINVFPVPAADQLHITISGNSTVSGEVLNSIGQVMWAGSINDHQDILVSYWPRGLYYLRFADNSGYKQRKIILE